MVGCAVLLPVSCLACGVLCARELQDVRRHSTALLHIWHFATQTTERRRAQRCGLHYPGRGVMCCDNVKYCNISYCSV